MKEIFVLRMTDSNGDDAIEVFDSAKSLFAYVWDDIKTVEEFLNDDPVVTEYGESVHRLVSTGDVVVSVLNSDISYEWSWQLQKINPEYK